MHNTTDMNNKMIIKALLPLLLLLLTGCSHNQNWARIDHPGSLDLINMGNENFGDEVVRITKAHDKIFLSFYDIYGPSFFSTFLLENTEVKKGETVLDMGTGSGIQAIYAAENASHVLAVDITERAIKNTLLNAKRHGVEDKISVRKSDLFNNISPDEKFDVIISNIPFPWDEKSQGHWKLQERFFNDVGKHLNPDGRIYFLSGLLDNLPYTRELVEKNNLKIVKMNMVYIDNLKYQYEMFTYLIKRATDIPGNKTSEST